MFKEEINEIEATYEYVTQKDVNLPMPKGDIFTIIEIAKNQQAEIERLRKTVAILTERGFSDD